MRKIIINLQSFILLALFPGLLAAQSSAEKTYDMMGYASAARKLESKEVKTTEDMEKIANSYRLIHDTKNAAIWYGQIVEKSKKPMLLFHYAQALQSNGDFEKAKEYYLKFDQLVGEKGEDRRGKLLAEAIDKMNLMKSPGKVVVENVSSINTEFHEFSPVYYRDGLLFVSNRTRDPKEGYKDNWMDSKFMNLYFSELRKDGEFEQPIEYSTSLNSDYHEGPSCFNHSGNQIYFSQNQNKKGRRLNSKTGIMKNDIYSSFKVGSSWSSPEKLPFNTLEYEEVHPALSFDGQYLLFASDRPGGLGGMDLYISKRVNGVWDQPKNLGDKVNTPGNEIFPFMQADNTLYFSSDGWGGVGGLDVFKIPMMEDEALEEVQNLGQPLNSIMDDFGLTMNLIGNEGYFSSDRNNGKGKDDIYKFSIEAANENDLLTLDNICFTDNSTGRRIDGAKLLVKEIDFNNISKPIMNFYELSPAKNFKPTYQLKEANEISSALESFVAGPGGDLSLQLVQGKKYIFEAEAAGFSKVIGQVDLLAGIPAIVDQCFALEPTRTPMLTVTGKVIDERSKLPLANVSVDIIEPCLNKSITVVTDADGRYRWDDAKCECELKINGSKASYFSNSNSTGSIAAACARGGIVSLDLDLSSKSVSTSSSSTSSSRFATSSAKTTTNSTAVSVGSSLELKNIYYDFNKARIRKTASTDLYQLAEIMKKYPSMVIELSSHTDSRGSRGYNLDLSQLRAEAAVIFLIANGIDESRLIAKGYGEAKLKNHCSNGRRCSEAEHQLNRRTEISILKLEEPIEVKQLNNWPIIIR